MGILDPAKLAVIGVLALIVLGPDKLPGTARRLGSAWRALAQLREQAEREVRDSVAALELPALPRSQPAQMVSSFLADLTRPTADPTRPTTVGTARAAEAIVDRADIERAEARPREHVTDVDLDDISMN